MKQNEYGLFIEPGDKVVIENCYVAFGVIPPWIDIKATDEFLYGHLIDARQTQNK